MARQNVVGGQQRISRTHDSSPCTAPSLAPAHYKNSYSFWNSIAERPL